MPYLFLLFLVVPLVEIYFLIQIGSAIGAGLTILLIVLTALIGAFLVRTQGLSTLMRAQNQMRQGVTPALEMLEGLMLFIAGAMLLIPGFFTDAIGFLLLTPPLRRMLIKRFISKQNMRTQHYYHQSSTRGTSQQRQGRVIDVDVEDDDRKDRE